VKILLDLSVFEEPPCGIGRVLLGLYDAFVHLVPSLTIEGVHCKSLQCELPGFITALPWAKWIPGRYLPLWRPVALPYYVSRAQPDFVHFPANKGTMPLYRGVRTILSINDLIPLALPDLYFKSEIEERLYRWTSQQSARYADLIVTLSEYSRRDIYRFLDCRSEVIIVPPANFLTSSMIDEESSRVPQENHYVYFGGYDPRKGLEVLVETFNELFTAGAVKIPLIIVGKPRYRKMPGLREKMLNASKAGAVIEAGAVSDPKLVHLIRTARALIYPSRYEGFGLPPLEAMTLGCPVITTRATSIPEVCGEAVLYVTPEDRPDLAKAILAMENNDRLRHDLRTRGIEQAKRFSWENSARIYLAALQRLLPDGNRATGS
jgi:glycosyltransferase involved in cell wall biosynthesis